MIKNGENMEHVYENMNKLADFFESIESKRILLHIRYCAKGKMEGKIAT